MPRYRGKHRTQFDGSTYQGSNCAPTSGANGARCATGGRIDKSGAQVRALVKRTEETSPATPGWSVDDLDLAMNRLGVPFDKKRGSWSQIVGWLNTGRGIQLPGDSDRFGNNTCSGAYDGNHSIYVHPDRNGTKRLIGDPICRDWRWEEESVLRAYAEKFAGGTTITYGLFTDLVPEVEDDMGLKVKLQATADPTPWGAFGKAKLRTGAISRVSDGANVALAAGTGLGTVQLGTQETTAIVAFNHLGELHVAPRANVDFTPIAPPSEDCSDEMAASYAEGKAAGYAEAKNECAPKILEAYQKGVEDTKTGATVEHVVKFG